MITNSFKKRHKILLLIINLIFVFNISAKNDAPIKEYKNEDLGISIKYPDNWDLSTNSDNANPAFKQYFPRKKDKNESPLFLGISIAGQLGTRLMHEVFAGTSIEYFDIIYGASPNVSTLSATYCEKSKTVEWEYIASNGMVKYVYKEILKKHGPRVVRLTFWTTEPVYQKYESKFDAIAEEFKFKNEKGKYTKELKGLSQCLNTDSLSYVKIAAPKTEKDKYKCGENSKPLFWEIKGEKNRVYLLGSIHVAKPEFYPFEERVETAFKNSKYIGVEIDNSSDKMTKQMSATVETSMIPKGKSLNDFITKPVYNKLVNSIGELGLPTENFLKMEPWLISITLVALKIQSLGYHSDFAVEKYFLDKKDSLQQIVEFETFEDQLSMLKSFNDENFLAYTLHSLSVMDVETNKLINAWKCGDIETMEEITFDDYGSTLQNLDDVYKRIYYDRNIKMVEKIEELLKADSDCFVILGSGHMIGEKGIVKLLETKGIKAVR